MRRSRLRIIFLDFLRWLVCRGINILERAGADIQSISGAGSCDFPHFENIDCPDRFFACFQECEVVSADEDQLADILHRLDALMREKRLFLNHNLTLCSLAKEAWSNRTYISNAVSRKKGMSFKQYVNSWRLDYAAKHLDGKGYDVYDMAVACGFRNARLFCKALQECDSIALDSLKKRYLWKNFKDMADEKIIFSMNGVGKILPSNNKVILKDIYLSFFYGAKIGIIGLNGSGKSTLMKIIAGIEKSYQGEVVFAPGYSVGYLEQEPQLDDSKTVREVVEEGVQEVVDLMKEYEAVNMKFMEPMSDEEMAKLIE